MTEVRCKNCGFFLCKVSYDFAGVLEITCRKCKTVNSKQITSNQPKSIQVTQHAEGN